MERSIDSPGDSSLDVDGAPSKAAASINFSVKSAANESTMVSQSQALNSVTLNECQNSKEPSNSLTTVKEQSALVAGLSVPEINTPTGKKPSYLNLACCVNGYSSINTYDSRIRQEINKSREVSPIRPTTTSVQCCKKTNTLSPPLPVTVSNQSTSIVTLSPNSSIETTNGNQNGQDGPHNNFKLNNLKTNQKSKSIIQQRVERLYGPGALAQSFYSPKKTKEKLECDLVNKHVAVFNQKILVEPQENYKSQITEGKSFDLPVLRHLSPEFRAQLPSISPKRSNAWNTEQISNHKVSTSSNVSSERSLPQNDTNSSIVQGDLDQPDHAPQIVECLISNDKSKDVISKEIEILKALPASQIEIVKTEKEKDGNYFLCLLRKEQDLLLSLANGADKYMEQISNDPEVTEDVLGILRAASGKARLLVSQKLKQFEGLCYNNINRSKEEKFPTTLEDLQGFWDMVCLQITNINLDFEEIESMRKNNWKQPATKITPPKASSKQQLSSLKPKSIKSKTTTNTNGNITRPSPDTAAAIAKREARRKQLDELKKKYKKTIAANSTNAASNLEATSIAEPPGILKNDECS